MLFVGWFCVILRLFTKNRKIRNWQMPKEKLVKKENGTAGQERRLLL